MFLMDSNLQNINAKWMLTTVKAKMICIFARHFPNYMCDDISDFRVHVYKIQDALGKLEKKAHYSYFYCGVVLWIKG